MARYLRILFLLMVFSSLPAGFFMEHEQAVFPWHTIPSIDAIFGGLGALLLILAIKILGSFASRKEDFYD
jgi:hypothetical protein